MLHKRDQESPTNLTRRQLLQLAAPVVLSVISVRGDALASSSYARSLSFYNVNTRERLTAVYKADGVYLPDGLNRINRMMRDWRENKIGKIAPALLDFIYETQGRLRHEGAIELISAYRSDRTNQRIGGAKKSFHLSGQAADIRVAGISLTHVRDAAYALGRGGIGYYFKGENRGFVHLDLGKLRSWGWTPSSDQLRSAEATSGGDAEASEIMDIVMNRQVRDPVSAGLSEELLGIPVPPQRPHMVVPPQRPYMVLPPERPVF